MPFPRPWSCVPARDGAAFRALRGDREFQTATEFPARNGQRRKRTGRKQRPGEGFAMAAGAVL